MREELASPGSQILLGTGLTESDADKFHGELEHRNAGKAEKKG